ncbi:hypothetical protein [uncultured Alistipes sp.]|nr:hypothetical protein [uncultured Alistipes sp.]
MFAFPQKESPTVDFYEVMTEVGFAGSNIKIEDNTAEDMTPVEW